MFGYYSNKLSLGYVNIPKNACTSAINTLYIVDHGKPYSKDENEGRFIHDFNRQNKKDIDSCKYRILIIRDPLSRLVSAYRNRSVHHNETDQRRVDKWINNPEIPAKPDLHQFIRHFAEYRKIPNIGHHTKPQHEFLDGNDLSYFTHVFQVEALGEFFAFIGELAGKPPCRTSSFSGSSRER